LDNLPIEIPAELLASGGTITIQKRKVSVTRGTDGTNDHTGSVPITHNNTDSSSSTTTKTTHNTDQTVSVPITRSNNTESTSSTTTNTANNTSSTTLNQQHNDTIDLQSSKVII
jgi:hypothetical protein